MAVSENDSVRFVLLKRAMRDDFAAVGATAWLCKTLQEIIYASPASWMRFSVVSSSFKLCKIGLSCIFQREER
jgi:hypothetical protein